MEINFTMRKQPRKTTPAIIENMSIPEPNSGCWLWLGYVWPAGYGRIYEGTRAVRAHRAAWIAYRGDIPADMHVCHRCDNRCCVNPDHLFLGTHAENMLDKIRKNRHVAGIRHGESNATSKLEVANILEIRASNLSQRTLAKQFGVNRATIHQIRAGSAWAHVPTPPTTTTGE